jgi:trans-aconitate methyltransferase
MLFRRAWMTYALRGVGQNDAHALLERAYLVPDPWKLDSAPERTRFAETNRHLRQVFGDGVGSLLEIGCGEGLQTEALTGVSRSVTGIDVSPTAIGRARRRLPGVEFAVGDLLSQPWPPEPPRFDVVVACEVLYYLSDVPRTLDRMERLARLGCLVTYFSPAERRIGRFLAARSGLERATISAGDTQWTVAWWRRPAAPGRDATWGG